MTTDVGTTTVSSFTPTDFLKQVAPVHSWGEWLRLAQRAQTFEEKLGLLHAGFAVDMSSRDYSSDYPPKEYELFDRLSFYFGVADGWTDSENFRTVQTGRADEQEFWVRDQGTRGRVRRRESEQRQLLAKTAFVLLCKHYFKPLTKEIEEADRGDKKYLIKRLLEEPEISMVRAFFAPVHSELYWRRGIRNLSHHRDNERVCEPAETFLLTLAKLMWEWGDVTGSVPYYRNDDPRRLEVELANEKREAAILANQLWLIDVLGHFKKLDMLEEHLSKLEEAHLGKLRERAFANQMRRGLAPVSEDRMVATLDEACYLGSQSGWLLKRHELWTRERQRLLAIREAEEARDKANRTINELQK